MESRVLVWDAKGRLPDGDWTLVLWRGFADKATPDVVSIPTLAEDQGAALKAAYLGWIFDLGECRIGGRRLLDHLELRPGFSYWWMTLVAEKCNWGKSPQITDAIRLFALDHWLANRPVTSLILASCSTSLAECVQSICERHGIQFEWRRTNPDPVISSWRKQLYRSLPLVFQALAWLAVYLIKRWPLRGVGLEEWRRTRGSVTFISYLFNLVPEALKDGRFASRYWAHLPEVLMHGRCDTNWLHIYVSDPLLPSAGSAADTVRRFNRTGQGRQIHTTLDAFLDLRLIVRTVRDWLHLVWISRGVTAALFSMRDGDVRLWPLFRDDWRRSMLGPAAIRNALLLNLYEAAMASLPCQRAGVYLYENDPTEFALIHAWEAAGHNRLIGSQHSTMLYWDMRYVFDSRSYAREDRNDLPMPHQVAVNGPAAHDACLSGGYPAERLVEVEALRYLYLAGSATRPRNPHPEPLRVLVLGDYMPDNTQAQLRMLEAAMPLLPADASILFKPHPSCPIRPSDYPGLRMELAVRDLPTLLEQCDVVFTSNATSAAVDAYCAGVPVVSRLNPGSLNLSPLRGYEAVRFACTPDELALAIGNAVLSAERQVRPKPYFTIDTELPRWQKLLLEPTD